MPSVNSAQHDAVVNDNEEGNVVRNRGVKKWKYFDSKGFKLV